MSSPNGRVLAAAAPSGAKTKTGRAVGSCESCGAGIATQGADRDTVGRCPHCRTRVRLRMVYGEHSATPCNGACMGAVGPSCSCSCGGANHGAWFLPVELVPVFDRAAAQAVQAKRTGAHTARAQAKVDAAAAEAAAGRDALISAHPDLAALLGEAYADADGFAESMRRALAQGYMTPRMIQKSVEMIRRDRDRAQERAARDVAEAAARAAGVRVPTGRVTFTGTITTAQLRDPGVTYNPRSVVKVIVRHADGWAVWGTLPAAYRPERYNGEQFQAWLRGLCGQAVTLTAELAPKPDGDGLFGFFKRAARADGQAENLTAAPARVKAPAPAAQVPAPAVDTAPLDAARYLLGPAYLGDDARADAADPSSAWAALVLAAAKPDAPAGMRERISAATRAGLGVPADAGTTTVQLATGRDRRTSAEISRASLAAYRAAEAPAQAVGYIDAAGYLICAECAAQAGTYGRPVTADTAPRGKGCESCFGPVGPVTADLGSWVSPSAPARRVPAEAPAAQAAEPVAAPVANPQAAWAGAIVAAAKEGPAGARRVQAAVCAAHGLGPVDAVGGAELAAARKRDPRDHDTLAAAYLAAYRAAEAARTAETPAQAVERTRAELAAFITAAISAHGLAERRWPIEARRRARELREAVKTAAAEAPAAPQQFATWGAARAAFTTWGAAVAAYAPAAR